MIAAEVSSGARSRPLFDRLRRLLGALPALLEPTDMWQGVAELRFVLARQGRPAHPIDLAIAITAAGSGHRLLTRDRDFEAIAWALSLDLDLF